MTMTQDSGGGGTAANLCPPSPSDLAGQINNLITRIENLEKAVAELQGQDVTATQLSDLSQQVGWVYDVTYLGVPGWTQTAAGTLIPPAGLALSTLGIVLPGLGGNPSTLVSTDSDGNPTFSINNSGTTGGGGGGTLPYASVYTAGSDIVADGINSHQITLDTVWKDTTPLGSLSSNTYTVSGDGEYELIAVIHYKQSGGGTIDSAAGTLSFHAGASRETLPLNAGMGPTLLSGDYTVHCFEDGIVAPVGFDVLVDNQTGVSIEVWVTDFVIRKIA